jgi:hypothetical protein
MTRRLSVLLLGSGLMMACASLTPTKTMQSWVGQHQADLFLQWGPPTRTTSDGADGTIVIYEYDRNHGQIPGRAVRHPDGSVTYTAPMSTGYVASRMFWVRPNGIIYRWRWQGL